MINTRLFLAIICLYGIQMRAVDTDIKTIKSKRKVNKWYQRKGVKTVGYYTIVTISLLGGIVYMLKESINNEECKTKNDKKKDKVESIKIERQSLIDRLTCSTIGSAEKQFSLDSEESLMNKTEMLANLKKYALQNIVVSSNEMTDAELVQMCKDKKYDSGLNNNMDHYLSLYNNVQQKVLMNYLWRYAFWNYYMKKNSIMYAEKIFIHLTDCITFDYYLYKAACSEFIPFKNSGIVLKLFNEYIGLSYKKGYISHE